MKKYLKFYLITLIGIGYSGNIFAEEDSMYSIRYTDLTTLQYYDYLKDTRLKGLTKDFDAVLATLPKFADIIVDISVGSAKSKLIMSPESPFQADFKGGVTVIQPDGKTQSFNAGDRTSTLSLVNNYVKTTLVAQAITQQPNAISNNIQNSVSADLSSAISSATATKSLDLSGASSSPAPSTSGSMGVGSTSSNSTSSSSSSNESTSSGSASESKSSESSSSSSGGDSKNSTQGGNKTSSSKTSKSDSSKKDAKKDSAKTETTKKKEPDLRGLEVRFGTMKSPGQTSNSTSVPLSFRRDLGDGHEVTIKTPITTTKTNGVKSQSVGVGVSYKLPMNDHWNLSFGGNWSAIDAKQTQTSAKSMFSSVSSVYSIYGETNDIHIANMIGFSTVSNIVVDGIPYDKTLKNTIYRNGIMISRPLELFHNFLTVEYSLVDTRFTGSPTYIKSFQEYGVSFGPRRKKEDKSVVRAGITLMRSKNANGWSVSGGYWF